MEQQLNHLSSPKVYVTYVCVCVLSLFLLPYPLSLVSPYSPGWLRIHSDPLPQPSVRTTDDYGITKPPLESTGILGTQITFCIDLSLSGYWTNTHNIKKAK